MPGQDAILMGLTLEGEKREAVVLIATAFIKGQRPMVVNPWREP